MTDRSICPDCGRQLEHGSCPHADCPGGRGDQRDRFPGRLTRYRVGAYVEFDVWAGDDGDACIIATHVGIPDARTRRFLRQGPLTMSGVINGNRVTAEAVQMRCLNVHENPEGEELDQ